MDLPFTERQRQVLAAIADWIDEHGYAPIGEELRSLLGRSTSVSWTLTEMLRDHGYITGEGRSMIVTRQGYEQLEAPLG